ncbi:Serine/threonine protein kinase (EC [Olavius algarvensis associated proteobacterium Delta 3]|nr:Serine/threonine protein kinase (EC [Olavius algarvensis associated proteobacterium Delta 3]
MNPTKPFPNDGPNYGQKLANPGYDLYQVMILHARESVRGRASGELVLAEPVTEDGVIVSVTLLLDWLQEPWRDAFPTNKCEIRVYDTHDDVLIISGRQQFEVTATYKLQTVDLSPSLPVSKGQFIGLRSHIIRTTGEPVGLAGINRTGNHQWIQFPLDAVVEGTRIHTGSAVNESFDYAGWHVNIAETAAGVEDAPTARPFKKADINRPAARIAHQLTTLVGTGNTIPAGARQKAAEHVQTMHARQAAQPSRRFKTAGIHSGTGTSGSVPIGTSAGLHHDNSGWISLGPHNVGGRTRAIVFDPKNDKRMFAGSASGGVWRSEDRGQTWFPTENLMGNLAVVSLAIDSYAHVFAGTGERFGRSDQIPGEGIFRSLDGWSWELIEATKVTQDNPDFRYVNTLAITSLGRVLLAGTATGIHRLQFDGDETRGKGEWVRGPQTLVEGGALIWSICIDPTDPRRAIASEETGQIFYSTDVGASWDESVIPDKSATRISLCYAAARSDPDDYHSDAIVYALKDKGSGNPDEIWRSTDGGASFKVWGAPADILKEQGSYDNVIWAGDPNDNQLVIAGGPSLFRITDEEKDSQKPPKLQAVEIADRLESICHADHHVLVSDPDYGKPDKRVWVGNDGGIYSTKDISSVESVPSDPNKVQWEDCNVGYGVTQFYDVAAHTGKRIVIAGAQDNGTRGHTPGEFTWDEQKVTGGDGGYVAADQRNPQLFYGEYVYGLIQRSDRSWDPVKRVATWAPNGIAENHVHRNGNWEKLGQPYNIPEAFVPAPGEAPLAEFIAPFLLDPLDNDVMLVGCTQLWRTTNASEPPNGIGTPIGPKWKSIKPGNKDGTITAIAIGRSAGAKGKDYSNVVLVGHRNGAIYVTTQGNVKDDNIEFGATFSVPEWKPISTPAGDRPCNCLAIDRRDPEKIFYAGFANFRPDNLWKTTDGGVTWNSCSGTAPMALPHVPIFAITLHPKNPDWVYVGAENGVFASEDGGRTWAPANEGPANVPCYGFTWIDNTLLVATHGRGVFQIDLTIRTPPDALLFGDDHGTLYRLDITDKYTTVPLSPGQELGDPLVVDPQMAKTIGDAYGSDIEKALSGCAFVGESWGKVRCVDAVTLQNEWLTTLRDSFKVHVAPALWACSSRDRVYLLVVTDGGSLHLLNPSDGDELRKLDPSDPKENWPVKLNDFDGNDRVWSCHVMDDWAFVTSTRGTYAVRLHPDAKVQWHHTASASSEPPLMAANRCYVSGIDGKLYALKARTDDPQGEEAWSPQDTGARVLPADTRTGTGYTAPYGRGDASGNVNFADWENHQLQKIAPDRRYHIPMSTAPVWSVGTVVVGNTAGHLVGFDHLTGHERFRLAASAGEIYSLGADDARIYWVGNDSGTATLHALDVTPGQNANWKPPAATWHKSVTGSPVSPLLIVADQVYFATAPGKLHVFDRDGEPQGSLSHAPDFEGIIKTVAGTGDPGWTAARPSSPAQLREDDGRPATEAHLNSPYGVAVDTAGNLFIADPYHHRVGRVDRKGIFTVVAGTGDKGIPNDGEKAIQENLKMPWAVAVDNAGNLFIIDAGNHCVRRVDKGGVITTVAGTGTAGFSGDGGPAAQAQLNHPWAVAVDTAGNLYIADSQNHCVRRVDKGGVITTVAGTDTAGFSGDGGPATRAQLNEPYGVAVNTAGNLFISDGKNHCVRRVDKDGVITTVAGTGTAGYSDVEDGGRATDAKLHTPSGVAVDTAGNLFIANMAINHCVLKVDEDGIITTMAGSGRSDRYSSGFSGDGGPATASKLNSPSGVAVGNHGNLYIADNGNNRVRRVATRPGRIGRIRPLWQ